MSRFVRDRLRAWFAGQGIVQPQPNILWICADDYTPDACSAYGNPLARTPNLARLASQGIRFDQAYCNCPLSTPSRQAFWTGRYPRSIGVTLSPTPLPDDEITLPALLRRSGYETAAFGKTHYYCPRRNEFDTCVDWQEYEDWRGYRTTLPLPCDVKVLGPWRPFVDPAATWLNSAGLPYAGYDEEMVGTYYATEAAKYLAVPKARPFFCYVSFYETHSPFWFPVNDRDRWDPGPFIAPPVESVDLDRLPTVFRDLSPMQKRGILASYFASAEFMDKNVGRVLDALDRSGHADKTVVIFTSDHGYLLGQHGRFEKHCCYDPAIRSVLLMRFPRLIHPGRASQAVVQLFDLPPTILELIGARPPGNMQGRSFVPLLKGKSEHHRDRVYLEYADNAEGAIRTKRWKFIYCSGGRRRVDGYAMDGKPGAYIELYDLQDDPNELRNLAADPRSQSVVGESIEELANHMKVTARDPDRLPRSGDPRVLLDHCLLPCDMDTFAYLATRARRVAR